MSGKRSTNDKRAGDEDGLAFPSLYVYAPLFCGLPGGVDRSSEAWVRIRTGQSR